MAKGEVSLITVHPDYGYGDEEVKMKLSTVPASSTLIYEIEMVDFTWVPFPSNYTAVVDFSFDFLQYRRKSHGNSTVTRESKLLRN